MKTSMRAIDFDPSNGANYIYIAYISTFEMCVETKKMYELAFSTLAFAMQTFNPWGNPDKWINDKGIWSLDFIREPPFLGFKVEIIALMLVVT